MWAERSVSNNGKKSGSQEANFWLLVCSLALSAEGKSDGLISEQKYVVCSLRGTGKHHTTSDKKCCWA